MIWSANSLFFKHPDIFGISFDSRKVKKGDLFIALSGSSYDGHDFVEEALRNGASCALVERKICENNIVVDSCFDTFVKIAKIRRSLFSGKVIAITGSVGKSTFRFSLVNSLISKFRIQSPIKNYNTLIGLSHFFSQFDLNSDLLVVELGVEYPGEMKLIADLTLPDYSLLMNISSAHSYALGSLLSILKEKSIIFKHTRSRAFFSDNIWYSDFLKDVANQNNLLYSTFLFDKDSKVFMKSAADSLFSFLKIDCPFSIARVAGRGDSFSFSFSNFNISVVDSSYNANISSMINDLKVFNSSFIGVKIAILGDMFGYSSRHHEFLSLYCKDFYQCWLVGEKMYSLHLLLPSSLFFNSIEELVSYANNFISNIVFNCSFFVKGSNCMELSKVVGFFKLLTHSPKK